MGSKEAEATREVVEDTRLSLISSQTHGPLQTKEVAVAAVDTTVAIDRSTNLKSNVGSFSVFADLGLPFEWSGFEFSWD